MRSSSSVLLQQCREHDFCTYLLVMWSEDTHTQPLTASPLSLWWNNGCVSLFLFLLHTFPPSLLSKPWIYSGHLHYNLHSSVSCSKWCNWAALENVHTCFQQEAWKHPRLITRHSIHSHKISKSNGLTVMAFTEEVHVATLRLKLKLCKQDCCRVSIKCIVDIHGPQRINLNVPGDPLTFLQALWGCL